MKERPPPGVGLGDPESLNGENSVSDGPAWMRRALAYQWGEWGEWEMWAYP